MKKCPECGAQMEARAFKSGKGTRYDCKPCGVVLYKTERSGRPRGRPVKVEPPPPPAVRGRAKELLAREIA